MKGNIDPEINIENKYFRGNLKCSRCGSRDIQKMGIRDGKQRVHCKVCGARVYADIVYNNDRATLKLDKKEGMTDWRARIKLAKQIQASHQSASWSQDYANPIIETKLNHIILQPFSDTHIGAIGTDYDLFESFTDYILKTPEIYIALIGDLGDNFVNFRNMLAVHQQIMSPEEQDEFLEAWIKEIKHKVLFSTWGNHEEFEERATGRNVIKRILKHNVIYMNGIGKIKLTLKNGKSNIDYEIAATHKTRYNSSYNITHGLKQLARFDIPSQDIYIGGDTHHPAKETTFFQGKEQIFLKMGTLKVNDGYAKRYFSYLTSSAMPCVALSTKEKQITDFWTMQQALEFCK